MIYLSNAPALLDSLKCGVDLIGDAMVTGGAIGFVLVFWALVRGA